MQVSVEKTDGLERKLTIEVPGDRVNTAMEDRLRSLARSLRIDGFRPGKAPIRVIKRQYGSRIRDEVEGDLINETLQEAIKEQNLMIAGPPSIVEREDVNGAFRYVATFEVFPEIELADFAELKIDRPQATVSESDVDEMIDKLRTQRATWAEVDRAAADKDRVTIDFVGKIDGEAFTGGSAEDFQLVLGSGQMIDGFEDAITGGSKGDSREFDVAFPEDYRAEHLAGKQTRFEVSIKQVEEQQLPELNDEFAETMQISDGGLEGLRNEVRSNMERELRRALRNKLKENVMDSLLAANPVTAPEAIVEDEMDNMIKAASQSQYGNFNLPRELYRERAQRRVSLGLLMREILGKEEVKLDSARVRERVEEIASTYEDPDSVIDWYYSDKSYLSQVESEVLEEQVVDLLVERATVSDIDSSFTDLVGTNR